MEAIVTAGGIPQPGDPLYPYTRGESKALLDVAGKPMIQWVLDALSETHSIDQVVIVGLPPGSSVEIAKPATFLPNHGEMLENIRAAVSKVREINPHAQHVLTVSSDVPAVTPTALDWVVEKAMETEHDFYYNIITRQVMESRFPGSNRSYVHLKGMEVCGGDINVIRTMTVVDKEELWERILASRKNAFKQAALIGYDVLILLFLRAITLERGVKMASERMGIKGRAILCPYAEIGMDIDKPHQLELLRADLASRVMA